MYALIGVIALEIAFGHSHQQADRSGAVRLVAATPFGSILLWLLVVGFAGMTLWRLSEAIWGAAGPAGHKTSSRLTSLVKAVIYAVITYGILKFALGLGAPASSNKQSQDLTAKALKYPGGQVVIVIVGAVIAIVGFALIYQAWKRHFLREMNMGTASPKTRQAVTRLGQIGGVARSSSRSAFSWRSLRWMPSPSRPRASTPRCSSSPTRRLAPGCWLWSPSGSLCSAPSRAARPAGKGSERYVGPGPGYAPLGS
jgi:uncharacterized membrane protein